MSWNGHPGDRPRDVLFLVIPALREAPHVVLGVWPAYKESLVMTSGGSKWFIPSVIQPPCPVLFIGLWASNKLSFSRSSNCVGAVGL